MTTPATIDVRRPRTDERALWDIIFGNMAYPALLIAHDLKLFPLLAEKPRTLGEICAALNIAPRPAQALLSASSARGLVRVQDDHYLLTPLAEDYLIESSPSYFGGFLDLLIANDPIFSFESVKRAVLTNSAQVYGGAEVFASHEAQIALARTFTHAMHGHSMGPAMAWPEAIDLSAHRVMLDVGGGSGAHAIGATLAWPNLRAIVLDLPPVCDIAAEFIASYNLRDRIKTHAGDIWSDSFPPADLHFYADIYHDWPPEKCRLLTRKSFESLEPGGRIIIHELLYDDDKTGPLAAAAYSIGMLLWTEGQQHSAQELQAILREAGFVDIEVKPTSGYWSIVMGRKPE